ncbi:hypothetical protein BV902_14330 [Sphingobacterium sp. B29]|nr:hypothetical protein BV902_14330 [Sphingobacterium sp. B29]
MKLHYLAMLTLGICTISGLKAQEKSNLIKLNLWSLSVGNIVLEYERSLNEHLSIKGTNSYRPKADLPLNPFGNLLLTMIIIFWVKLNYSFKLDYAHGHI